MFTEESPKDLSQKPETEGTVSDTNTDKNDNNNEVENTMDLSVKSKPTTVEDQPMITDDSEEAEPMDVTLDLSMPSASIESTDKINGNDSNNNANQEVTNEASDTSDANKSEADTPPQTINGGNHVNGYLASDDSVSINADEDLPLPPSPKVSHLSLEELNRKQRRMRRLKQELRNEEMKLVLLKKLKQSQLMKENIVTTNLTQQQQQQQQQQQPNNVPLPVTNSHTVNKLVTNSVTNVSSRNGSVSSTPPHTHQPPVVAHNNRVSAHSNSSSKANSVLNSPYGRNQSLPHAALCPPPLGLVQRNSSSNHTLPTAAHSQSHHSSHRPGPLGSMNRTPVTTPPNVVLGYPVQDLRAPPNSNSLLNSHPSMGLVTGSPGPTREEVTQTPAQRQAAAKLALRKQLEKTLLQIPPPKPPPPEMHFIPNANNPEFVYYVGLETVVDFLTDSPNLTRPPPDPFECVQCGTDFTPVWKWQDRIDTNRDRPAVICETCVTSNIKKALKAEHTNRLKTAFVKALQQEQEIEQRIASGATSPPLPAMSPTPPQNNYNNGGNNHTVSNSSSFTPSSQALLPQAPPAHSSINSRLTGSVANAAAAAAAVASSAALLQQMPKLSAAHQSLFAAQAQQLQQLAQSLPQPQPAHMLPFGPLLAAQAYSYSMLSKSGVPPSDLHRQYLLDMIPRGSLPQNWKT
ncbi:transcriptional repressor p66-beta-like [Oppia nitens]|uniref:transcriptional repressor p66-beta-like n=1 Tax=Oppia nitens TaxID=1686743 RepID=UPI0023DC9186|nr:transcriptional repressor p66-beta-like [Oppia nitens]